MNYFFNLLALIFLISKSISAADFELFMDCGSQNIFVGEKVLCQFVLTGQSDVVEVEVVKFPEFRGFWSENLSLRQGLMTLVPAPTRFGIRKQIVIGSYDIHRMVEKKTSEIIPMKISLRKRGNSRPFSEAMSPPIFLLSQNIPFQMKPLPPIPSHLSDLSFTGAVGQFFIPQKEIEANYRLDEPVELRVSLKGRGNFTEVNRLPLKLPEGSEIISEKTFTSNTGNELEKSFLFSILLKAPPPEIYSLGRFLFFDSTKRSYQTLDLPKIKFSIASQKDREGMVSFQLPEPEEEWSPTYPLRNSPLFWLTQASLLLVCLGYRFRDWQSELARKKRASEEFKRQQIWNAALEAQKAGDTTKFVQLATILFTDLLKEKGTSLKMRTSEYPTKRQLVAAARNSFSKDQLASIEALFSQYDEIYSPDNPPPSIVPLIESLNSTLNKGN